VTTVLVILTVVEIVAVLLVLVVYLIAIARSLARISENLGKVTFGVRAIETQTSSIGPSVTRANEQLATIAGALDGLVDKAGRATSSS
jgi:hypothetical protein